jgi:hypothetical protein
MEDDASDVQGGQPESAEDEAAADVSEDLPAEAGGEGATPLGSSDEHSEAPGPHGLGPVAGGEEEEDPGLAPLEGEEEAD